MFFFPIICNFTYHFFLRSVLTVNKTIEKEKQIDRIEDNTDELTHLIRHLDHIEERLIEADRSYDAINILGVK